MFVSHDVLTLHVSSSHKRFQCDQCSAKFFLHAGLGHHIQSHSKIKGDAFNINPQVLISEQCMSRKVITHDEGVSNVGFKKNEPVAKKSTGGGKHSVNTKIKTSTMTPTPPLTTTANDMTPTPPPTMTTATDIVTTDFATDTADSTVTSMTPTPPTTMTTATDIVTTEFSTPMTYNIVMTITPTPPPPMTTVTDMTTELARHC